MRLVRLSTVVRNDQRNSDQSSISSAARLAASWSNDLKGSESSHNKTPDALEAPRRNIRSAAGKTATLLLLVSSIVITLVAVLLPNSSLHAGTLVIRPTNQPAPTTAVTTSTNLTTTFGEIGVDEAVTALISDAGSSPFANLDVITTSASAVTMDETGTPVTRTVTATPTASMAQGGSSVRTNVSVWLGENGPTIWVGVMTICSRFSAEDGVTCTSASDAAFHAASLPLSLGSALLALPTSPSAPIILLVLLLVLLIQTAVTVGPLLPHLPRPRCHARKCACLPNKPNAQSGSPILARYNVQAYTMPCSAAVGTGLAVAATAVVHVNVGKASAQWDTTQADEVGLVLRIGSIAILVPFLALCQSGMLMLGLWPAVSRFRMTRQMRDLEQREAESDADKAPEVEKQSGGLDVEVEDDGKTNQDGIRFSKIALAI